MHSFPLDKVRAVIDRGRAAAKHLCVAFLSDALQLYRIERL